MKKTFVKPATQLIKMETPLMQSGSGSNPTISDTQVTGDKAIGGLAKRGSSSFGQDLMIDL